MTVPSKNDPMYSGDRGRKSRTMVPATPAGAIGMPVTLVENDEMVEVKAEPPMVLSSSPTPFGLLVALRRRWLLALTLGLLFGAGGTAAIWYFQPISWSVRTVMHISANRPYIAFENADARADFANYQRSQLFLVKSRTVLNAALRRPGSGFFTYRPKTTGPGRLAGKRTQGRFRGRPGNYDHQAEWRSS